MLPLLACLHCFCFSLSCVKIIHHSSIQSQPHFARRSSPRWRLYITSTILKVEVAEPFSGLSLGASTIVQNCRISRIRLSYNIVMYIRRRINLNLAKFYHTETGSFWNLLYEHLISVCLLILLTIHKLDCCGCSNTLIKLSLQKAKAKPMVAPKFTLLIICNIFSHYRILAVSTEYISLNNNQFFYLFFYFLRCYPGPWKVLRKARNKYVCVHQQETMPSLKEVALDILPSA